jgi:uncharacterized protein involved in type VI secretion and phage assembly
MAGANKGAYFLPEIGDEVLVAFEHGDLSSPVVLGSLWNGKAPPPEKNIDGLNNIRLIKTKSGHTLTFDDTTGQEKIVIQDMAGSQVTLNGDGTVTISARQGLTLQATNGNLTLEAMSGNIALNANNVNVSVTGTMDVS